MNYNEFIDSLSSSYKNLLNRLTSASSELPPGYLYNELIEFVKTNPSKLYEIEEYLINKLSRKEPYIKLKCLKLLKILCIKFPKDFIRSKVTQSHLVLDCKNFKSPHSEYLGDNLTKLVRTECEELIKIVCSYDNNNLQTENKMVGFGNNQYNNFNNQTGNYINPGIGNPNMYSQNTTYNTYTNKNQGRYGNSGMMGFGNPNMYSQNTTYNTNGFASFASTFTPTVSELKNAGNNALKMLSNAANKYLPSDFVEKIEKVSSVITTTATEQFEKYLGNRSPMGRNDPRNLNNSMYSTRGGQPYSGTGGYGYNSGTRNQGGYSPQGFGSGYNSTSYNAPVYNNPQTYSNPQLFVQPPQSYSNPLPYSNSQSYSSAQAFASQQPVSSSPSFSSSRNTSVASNYNQGFGAFPTQPSVHQTSISNLSHTTSVGNLNPPREPSIDLFSTSDASKYTVPGEREVAFVKEMLTFTGIKVSPSPRLVEEYMAKMKDMDKGLVVGELIKHLNVRSTKWQTHFRILCLLESLVVKGNLDDKTLKELKKTGIPIVNKCKDEPQLVNKASKLVSLLSTYKTVLNESSIDTEQVTDLFSNQLVGFDTLSIKSGTGNSNDFVQSEIKNEVEDLFNSQSTDLFTNKSNEFVKMPSLERSSVGIDNVTNVLVGSVDNNTKDPVDSKVNELDLFFNTSDTHSMSYQSTQTNLHTTTFPSVTKEVGTSTNIPNLVTTNVNNSTSSKFSSENNKVDFFDFDNLAFNNQSSNNTNMSQTQNNNNNLVNVQRVIDPSMQPIISNIDNNLDLFDNTDFTNFLDKKTDDLFTNPQNNFTNNNSNSNDFDLI